MGRDVVTKSQKLDPRTNTAQAIKEAAAWLQKALETNDKEETKKLLPIALWHLYTTGVTEVTPPTSNNIRF